MRAVGIRRDDLIAGFVGVTIDSVDTLHRTPDAALIDREGAVELLCGTRSLRPLRLIVRPAVRVAGRSSDPGKLGAIPRRALVPAQWMGPSRRVGSAALRDAPGGARPSSPAWGVESATVASGPPLQHPPCSRSLLAEIEDLLLRYMPTASVRFARAGKLFRTVKAFRRRSGARTDTPSVPAARSFLGTADWRSTSR